MKRLMLLVVAMLATVVSATAQMKISSPHPDLDIQIKRCANANGTVIIDMVITNYGIEEAILMYYYDISMYDDEGNSYNNHNSKIRFGFPNKGLTDQGDFTFPQDIPLKFRFSFGSISANASKFSLIKIGIRSGGAMGLSRDKPLTIRHLEWVK